MSASVTSGLIRLKEGNVYPFHIKGLTLLPDGIEYYVLIDPNQVRHLLESIHYMNYHFEVGQAITCRIDKINCNGKIYIEPLHPYYRVGKSYKFPLIRFEESSSNPKEINAVLEDVFCNEIKLPLVKFNKSLRVGQNVNLKIARIKRGKVFIAEPGFEEKFAGMNPGTEYSFLIQDLFDSHGNRSYFLLMSSDSKKFKLRHKFYEKYEFKIGQNIVCRLIQSGREFYLEPVHPYYKINHNYDFEIIEDRTIPDYPFGEKRILILRNDYGKNIYLPVGKTNFTKTVNNRIKCRVKNIRKGKLIVKFNK